jgi:hypothetical protein
VILTATSVNAHHKPDPFLSSADTSSLFFLVQIILRTRACGGGTGCSGLIHRGGEDDDGDVNGKEIFGYRGKRVRASRPAFVLQFLPASQPLSPLAFRQSLIYSRIFSFENVHS